LRRFNLPAAAQRAAALAVIASLRRGFLAHKNLAERAVI
jgi:hypothetical protein